MPAFHACFMYCIKFIVKPHFPSTQKGHLTIK
nr:MAG TPA: hypothetical protein [Bacteriophage sp.]DAK05454.1 MAG TPA: hypothetical protein [Caudoviricetes sp.]